MAELVPSVLMHSQAVQLLKDLTEAHKNGAIQTVDKGIEMLASILGRFEDGALQPLLNYEPVSVGEPPSTDKTNRFFSLAARDMNVLQQQVDITHAAVRFTHNQIATEIMRAKNENARVNNKLKTLQMYSTSLDANTITFGDTFRSLGLVDLSVTPDSERASLFGPGFVTLAPDNNVQDISADAEVTIRDDSNGFLGNNHEAETFNEGKQESVLLKSEVRDYSNLSSIVDGNPTTWIEYEKYALSPRDIEKVRPDTLSYQRTKPDGTTEMISWVGPPSEGALRLTIQYDFKKEIDLNSIEFTPFGLDNNQNHPVVVKQVSTSRNGTDWMGVQPSEVWIGTEVNLQAARAAKNVVTEKAAWAFETRKVRYVRVHLEQPTPIDVNLGHVYWVEEKENMQIRVSGPTPSVDDPGEFNSSPSYDGYTQYREVLPAKRWAIGVRDITMHQTSYSTKSVLVTDLLRVGGIVDRVVLQDADFIVPSSYPTDQSWVNFWISPDDGRNWFPISRIQDDFLNIPEQIAFNDPLPDAFQEMGVAYHEVDQPVTSLRLKIELLRPESTAEVDYTTTTPILKSYVLKVRRR